MNRITVVLVLMALIFFCSNSEGSVNEWKLFGRHGECAPLASLKRKLPDLPAIKTPDELSAHLDSKRHKYTRSALKGGPDGAVEFQVPDIGLAIVLVESRHCAAEGKSAR